MTGDEIHDDSTIDDRFSRLDALARASVAEARDRLATVPVPPSVSGTGSATGSGRARPPRRTAALWLAPLAAAAVITTVVVWPDDTQSVRTTPTPAAGTSLDPDGFGCQPLLELPPEFQGSSDDQAQGIRVDDRAFVGRDATGQPVITTLLAPTDPDIDLLRTFAADVAPDRQPTFALGADAPSADPSLVPLVISPALTRNSSQVVTPDAFDALAAGKVPDGWTRTGKIPRSAAMALIGLYPANPSCSMIVGGNSTTVHIEAYPATAGVLADVAAAVGAPLIEPAPGTIGNAVYGRQMGAIIPDPADIDPTPNIPFPGGIVIAQPMPNAIVVFRGTGGAAAEPIDGWAADLDLMARSVRLPTGDPADLLPRQRLVESGPVNIDAGTWTFRIIEDTGVRGDQHLSLQILDDQGGGVSSPVVPDAPFTGFSQQHVGSRTQILEYLVRNDDPAATARLGSITNIRVLERSFTWEGVDYRWLVSTVTLPAPATANITESIPGP